MISKAIKTFLFFVLFLVFIHPVLAQRQTGSIIGRITDEEGEFLPGASITLSGPSLMGLLTYSSTSSGHFRFSLIPPGKDYVLLVVMPGFQTEKLEGIAVQVGKTVSVKIPLKATTLEEEITVTSTASPVDLKSNKISMNYTEDFIQNLPFPRDYYKVLLSSPGIVSEENELLRTFTTHGSTVRSNQIALEGVNTTDSALGVNINNLSFDAIKEYEIVTGGHPAEIGSTEGAYVNIVTKSGSNTFGGHASVMLFGKNMVDSLISKSEAESVGLSRPSGQKRFGDFSLSLGGPIILDKLWFFINGRYLDYAVEKESLPDGPFDMTHKEIMTFAKLSFSPHPKVKLAVMWSFGNTYEPVQIKSPFGSEWDFFYREKSSWPAVDRMNNHALLGKLDWIIDQDSMAGFRINYFRSVVPLRFQSDINPSAPTIADLYTNVWSGAPRWEEDLGYQKILVSGSGTRFLDGLFGTEHELKAGIEYEFSQVDWDLWKNNPYMLTAYDGHPWGLMNIQPFMGIFRGLTCGANKGDVVIKTRTRRWGMYIQDSFTIQDRLTLNLGLRYDETHGDLPGGTYRPAGANDLVLSLLAPSFYKETTLEDRKNATVWKDLSPRIGAVLDIFGDGKTTLKLSWSRYSEFLIAEYFLTMNPYYPIFPESYWLDMNMNGIIEISDMFQPTYIPPDPEKFVLDDRLDPDLKSPYLNEYLIGLEREWFKDFRAGVFFIHRTKKRVVEDVDSAKGYRADSGWWIPYTVLEPGWDGLFGTSDDGHIQVYGAKNGSPQSRFWFTNPEGAERKYQALEFFFDKSWSNRWQLSGSLTLSKFEGTIGANFDATWGHDFAFNSPNWLINRYGRLDLDRPLLIKLLATVLLPYDFYLSAYYFHTSGAPFTRTLWVQLPPDPAFEFPMTFVGFDAPIYAESPGEHRHPSRNNLDIRIEKTLQIKNRGSLGIFLDIMNVFGENWFDVEKDPGGIVYADGTFERWPRFGTVVKAHGVRIFKLGVRFTF
jgi:hypothetical protein